MYNRVVLAVICSFFVLSVNAQDTLKAVEVIYQANGRTPVTYQNIGSKVLDDKNTGQEPSFLLSETPSVTVYSDAGNTQGYSYYRLRGMDQTRVNTTLDGMPLNEPEDQGAYFSNYPDVMNSVSKIQIQRGVGTSKNGTAGYAGSVQLFAPDLTEKEKTTFGVGYGSYNSFRVFGEYQSGIKNRKSLYVRASQVYTDGYKYHSANNSQSVFISGGLFYDKTTWKINVMAGHQQNDMAWLGVADSLIKKDRRNNANVKDEKDNFFQGLVQLQNSWQLSKKSVINTSVYYTTLKGNYDFDINNYIGMPSDGSLFNYAFQSNFAGLFSNYTYTAEHVKWTSGIHGNIYDRQHLGSDNLAGELYKNKGYKKEGSAFSKIEYTVDKINLFADIQYRSTSFDYKGSVPFEKLNWQFLNPKAGVSVDVNPHTNVYYSIGRTGREPTRNDMFGGNDDLTADSAGAAMLYSKDAEYVTDHELGIRLHTDCLNVQFNGYYMNFRNEIVLNGKIGPNGLVLTDNVKSSYRTGLELSAAYHLHHFIFTNNSSFNYSRIKEQTSTFTPILTPALIINQEVAYERNRVGIALSGRYQGKSFVDFANDVSLDDYVLLNARAHYTLKHYEVSVFVNNIANAKYINNGYVEGDGTRKYFVQAPTNFYIAFKYSF